MRGFAQFAGCLALAGWVLGCSDEGSSGQPGETTSSGTTGEASDGLADGSTSSMQLDLGGLDDGGDDAPMGECLLHEPAECGDGQKCMPFSLSPDRIPDGIKCCDAVESPDLTGEACEIFEFDGSCRDTCAAGSMCVLDDDESLSGFCREFCEPAASTCPTTHTCKSFFELLPGVPNVPLCMLKCDPLLQDCPEPSWHCIPDTPTESGQSGFLCSPPPPTPPKQLFEPCALANDCEAGLVCLTGDRVPGCTFSSCCSAYCSLSEGDQTCSDLSPDLECVDWMSPDPQWEDIGACALPM